MSEAKPNKEPAGLRVSVYLKTNTLKTDTRRPADGLLGFAALNPTYEFSPRANRNKSPRQLAFAGKAKKNGLRKDSRAS